MGRVITTKTCFNMSPLANAPSALILVFICYGLPNHLVAGYQNKQMENRIYLSLIFFFEKNYAALFI